MEFILVLMSLLVLEKPAAEKLPVEIFCYPAWVYMDDGGKAIYHQEGTAEKPDTAEFESRVQKRDAALKEAEGLQGLDKARKIGEALGYVLDPVMSSFSQRAMDSYMSQYKKELAELKKCDPEDALGYYLKYNFIILPNVEGVICKNLSKKDYAANDAYIERELSKQVLLPNQRQEIMLFKYKNLLEQDKLDEAMQVLADAIAVKPDTPVAEACRNVRKYFMEPVRLTSLSWRQEDNRPRWHKVILELGSVVNKPGKYEIKFVHEAGRTLFRAGGKEGTVFEYNYDGQGNPEFHFEIRGTGWFDGRGRIEVK